MRKSLGIVLCTVVSGLMAMGYYSPPAPRLEPIKIPSVSIPQPPMDCVPPDQQRQRNIYYCPQPTDLVRNGVNWSAPGGWKSNQVSFTTQLRRFIGAQWIGTNVGRVLCLYTGDNINDFPVQIVLPALAILPDLPVWDTTSDTSQVNCVSQNNQVCDCPIQIFRDEEPPSNARAAVAELTAFN